MKMRLFFFTLLLSLALCLPAMAQTKDFGKFKMLVPAGWTDAVDGSTVSLKAPDKSAAITITIGDREGASAAVIAKAFSKEFNGSAPEEDEDGDCTFTFKNASGVDAHAAVSIEGKNFILITLTGEHPDADKILESIEEK